MRLEQQSKLLQDAVDALATLPGIGSKSALRLVLYMLRQEDKFTYNITQKLNQLVENIHYCEKCHNLSDSGKCIICRNPKRDKSIICVVESIREVLAIENTGSYNGLYHILGGVISPIDGVGPSDLFIDDILTRVKDENIAEVLLALSTTMEGDTTNFYIYRLLKPTGVKLSVISRGVSIGDEIEYADQLTLGRSIEHRVDFESTLKKY